MVQLHVAENRLSGTIPLEIFGATALKHFRLNNMLRDGELSALTGTLSPLIGDLQQLETLDLSHNLLHGTLPLELWSLPNLERLFINAASFNGTLAKEVSKPLVD
jgi:hypothetical protein